MRFSIDEYKIDRTKRNKISYPCTNDTNTNTNKQASTNEQNKFIYFIIKIGFGNLKKIVGYCLTSSSKAIQKRVNGNIKVYGSYLKF